MKKKILIFATMLLICCLSFVLVACGDDQTDTSNQEQQNNQPEIKLVAILVDGPAQADIDEFDLSDYKIVATFSDGSTKKITLTSDFISADDLELFETEGLYSVKVSYQNKTCTWNITISSNKEEDLCKDGHKPVPVEENIVAATCTKDGSFDLVKYCLICKTELSREKKTIPALEHDIKHHDAQDATCAEVGWYEYDTCSRCDYTTYVEIPALNHDLIHHDAQDPTCTEVGWYEYDTCSRCDYTTYEEISALNHDLVHHNAQDATCTEIGWCAYDTCSRCDYTTYEEIPALNHDLIHHNAQDATCTEVGWYAYDTCSRCDYTTYQEIPALNHNYVNEICTRCGVWQYLDVLGFSLNEDEQSYTIYGTSDHSIKSLIIPSFYQGLPVTKIGDYAFMEDTQLMKLVIPESINTIGEFAFRYCYHLVEIYNFSSLQITNDDSDGCYVGSHAINIYTEETSSKLTVHDNGFVIFDGTILVNYIGEETNITIPNEISTIYNYAFFNNQVISHIIIPESVENIGHHSFYGCTELSSILIPNEVIYIGEYAFCGCSKMVFLTLGESVTQIGEYAFWECFYLKEIYNKSSLSITIGSYDNGCIGYYALNIITSESEIKTIITDDGFIIYDQTNLIGYIGDESNITIPNGIISISPNAFNDCNFITSIIISNSVESIGSKAFYNCEELINVTIGENVTSIDSYAFMNCTALGSIIIPNKVINIGEGAFENCHNLEEVTIGENVQTIGRYAFDWCRSLSNIIVSNQNIKYRYANGCLIEIDTNKLITGISCEIPLDESILIIGTGAFSGCSGLINATIPDGVVQIEIYAFSGCDDLISVIMPDSIERISDFSFVNCYNLTNIEFKGTVEQWMLIEKGSQWCAYCDVTIVHCTDGDVSI